MLDQPSQYLNTSIFILKKCNVPHNYSFLHTTPKMINGINYLFAWLYVLINCVFHVKYCFITNEHYARMQINEIHTT